MRDALTYQQQSDVIDDTGQMLTHPGPFLFGPMSRPLHDARVKFRPVHHGPPDVLFLEGQLKCESRCSKLNRVKSRTDVAGYTNSHSPTRQVWWPSLWAGSGKRLSSRIWPRFRRWRTRIDRRTIWRPFRLRTFNHHHYHSGYSITHTSTLILIGVYRVWQSQSTLG